MEFCSEWTSLVWDIIFNHRQVFTDFSFTCEGQTVDIPHTGFPSVVTDTSYEDPKHAKN